MSKGPSTYARKPSAPRYSEEYAQFHLSSQHGSKSSSELDHWRRAQRKRKTNSENRRNNRLA